jgi:two-component system clock-associated histidine kinase SasA
MQVSRQKLPQPEAQLQMLLFVDQRPSSRQQVERIRHYLEELQANYQFELQIVDVTEQPYLAEHFKLVATPALIKIYPEPRHTLAGNDLIAQLQDWWPRWQNAAQNQLNFANSLSEIDNRHAGSTSDPIRSVAASTELIRLADEVFRLKQEKEKLLEQLHFKDRVIAMLAHDLRNPLTAISIAIETLELNYKPNSSEVSRMTPALALQLFKQARTQTRTIDQMIAGLLQVERGNDANFHIQPQKLELAPLCQDAIEQLSDRFHAKAQQVEKDVPKDLPHVYCDPQKVHQVLMNLLDNATKYTPEGGFIRLSCLHRTTQKVQVSVCDTGLGIPEDNRDYIFEDGFRLQRDEAKEGYGIGLSLCQRIVRAHYGQIWVDPAPNGGSCFHFTLPVYPA